MIQLRKSSERGQANHGWLQSQHTFSFADYYDPQQMNFRTLRVINEDHIAGGAGFPTHPHRDMEIITYVVSGAVAHRDSTGGQGVIRPGQLQHMSAGTGVQHSEFNASATESAHLLQIWIVPAQRGLAPRYQDLSIEELGAPSPWTQIASGSGKAGLQIAQDVDLFVGKFQTGETHDHHLGQNRAAWIQLISGNLQVNGETLRSGDAAAVTETAQVQLRAEEGSHFLLFDLA